MPRWGLLGAIAFGFVGLVLLFKGVDWAVELLWMRGLGYEAVFWRLKAADGTPLLIIKDLPPQGPVDLAVLRPEIYYGEEASGYRIVNTRLKEFD